MEHLAEDPILQFHSDTLLTIRKLYNLEDQQIRDEIVSLLDDWVKKQKHFIRKDYSNEYLERSVILLKGSVERAKTQLDRICTARSHLPKFFEISNPKHEFECLAGKFAQGLLPKLTKEHNRVYASKFLCNDLNSMIFFTSYKYAVLLCEYIKAHDYCGSFVVITDFRDINIIDFVSKVNLMEIRQIINIVMSCYQMRVKGIHIVSESKAVNVLVQLFKQLFSTKVGNRICVHMDVETVYDYVEKEILPKELGGEEKSLVELSNDWIDLLSTEKNIKYFKEMSEARTDESLRVSDTFKDQFECVGTAGTFRRLNLD